MSQDTSMAVCQSFGQLPPSAAFIFMGAAFLNSDTILYVANSGIERSGIAGLSLINVRSGQCNPYRMTDTCVCMSKIFQI